MNVSLNFVKKLVSWIMLPVLVVSFSFVYGITVKASYNSSSPPVLNTPYQTLVSTSLSGEQTREVDVTFSFADSQNVSGRDNLTLLFGLAFPGYDYNDSHLLISFEDVEIIIDDTVYSASYYYSGSETSGYRYILKANGIYVGTFHYITIRVKLSISYDLSVIYGISTAPGSTVGSNSGTISLPRYDFDEYMTCTFYAYAWSNGVLPASQVSDSAMHSLQQQTNNTLNSQLQEQQKQTDAMINFSGSGQLDSSASDLNNSLTEYDNAESSVFETSSGYTDSFDITSVFDFATGTMSAIVIYGNWMTSIINHMGDFSILFTLGMALLVIILLTGLFRYFSNKDS